MEMRDPKLFLQWVNATVCVQLKFNVKPFLTEISALHTFGQPVKFVFPTLDPVSRNLSPMIFQ